jgi:hypothetical protein
MQKVHELLQPTEIVTHAVCRLRRRDGRSAGMTSRASASSHTGPASARVSSLGKEARLWVPNTTSTWGARRWMLTPSFWARHPPTAMRRSGRTSLRALRWPRVP